MYFDLGTDELGLKNKLINPSSYIQEICWSIFE